MRSRLPHKRDANHAEITQAFQQLGCTVFDASALGDGFPDLVVGLVKQNLLVECKTKDGELTPPQQRLIEEWRGEIHVVDSPEMATTLVQLVRRAAR